jgi:uncharacterized lipoprotein YajG
VPRIADGGDFRSGKLLRRLSMNAKFWLAGSALVFSLGMQGCTLKTQYLHIDPEVKVNPAQIGENKTIGLRVVDGRSDKKLGEVGDPDRKMVDVRVDEDPGPAVYERVKQALTKLGFTVQPFSDGMDRTLEITIRRLALQSVKQPLTFDTELRAEVNAHAANSAAYYDRQFNVRTRKVGAAPPYEKDSTVLVNTAMSQALEDLLADEKLLTMLAQ